MKQWSQCSIKRFPLGRSYGILVSYNAQILLTKLRKKKKTLHCSILMAMTVYYENRYLIV